jgi:hypothetical protein
MRSIRQTRLRPWRRMTRAENDPSGEPVEIILTDNPATGAAEKFLAARFNEKSFGD